MARHSLRLHQQGVRPSAEPSSGTMIALSILHPPLARGARTIFLPSWCGARRSGRDEVMEPEVCSLDERYEIDTLKDDVTIHAGTSGKEEWDGTIHPCVHKVEAVEILLSSVSSLLTSPDFLL